MPGSQKNEWSSYLNGGTSHYNFSYRNESTLPEPIPPNTPIPQPIAPPNLPNISPTPNTSHISNKKKQSAGKRKTKHRTKKYKYSRRK
jgi:hypothetical protein